MTASEVTALAPRPTVAMSLASAAMSIQDIVAQKQLLAQCMREVMKADEHYGIIPGAKKPSLWKPGADLIGFLFQLEADYADEETVRRDDYIYYRRKCILTHIPTGRRVGAGVGSCNSREEKYVRAAPRKCPNCSKETIIKGKEEYGGGWLCFVKKGGCGGKWKDGDQVIEGQDTGIADPSDLDNTILKMANKRARIDAILTATAASDFFTQDVEDLSERAARLVVHDAKEEYIPPKGGADPKGATGAVRPSTVPATASAGSTAQAPATTVTKKRVDSGAADVKHDGVMLSPAQLTKIQILRKECGGKWCTDEGDDRTGWRKVLGVYRDQIGERIKSSRDLSKYQASHLIERMAAYVEQHKNVDPIDIGHIPDKYPDAAALADLRGKIQDQDFVEPEWVGDLFGVDNAAALTKNQAETALQLLLERQKGPVEYDVMLERAIRAGLVNDVMSRDVRE